MAFNPKNKLINKIDKTDKLRAKVISMFSSILTDNEINYLIEILNNDKIAAKEFFINCYKILNQPSINLDEVIAQNNLNNEDILTVKTDKGVVLIKFDSNLNPHLLDYKNQIIDLNDTHPFD